MRRLGFGLMVLGVVLVLVWAIEPIGFIWPWLRGLPWPLRIGVGAAAVGVAVLFGSLIQERIKDREKDKSLLDEI